MFNMINRRLADSRDIDDTARNELNILHFIMDAVIRDFHNLPENIPKLDIEEYREAVQFLEYNMQDRWGFSRRADKHTHWRRLYNREGTISNG